MCGRFYFGEDTGKEISRVVHGRTAETEKIIQGDIHPSERSVVITGKSSKLFAEAMYWGFPANHSSQLMINARAESVLEKKSFCDSVLHRRCVIPAHHFYEWDCSKNKVTFTQKESRVLYMAGFYKRFDNVDRFIILTTEANRSMSPVHDRMPLILQEEEIRDWIFNDTRIREFLKKESPILSRSQEFEQLSLVWG